MVVFFFRQRKTRIEVHTREGTLTPNPPRVSENIWGGAGQPSLLRSNLGSETMAQGGTVISCIFDQHLPQKETRFSWTFVLPQRKH